MANSVDTDETANVSEIFGIKMLEFWNVLITLCVNLTNVKMTISAEGCDVKELSIALRKIISILTKYHC